MQGGENTDAASILRAGTELDEQELWYAQPSGAGVEEIKPRA